jgi:transposase
VASEVGRVSNRKGRPNYAPEFKRQLAAAACAADISVSRLARERGINANMLFKWRRQYRAGLLGDASAELPVLQPVTVRAAIGLTAAKREAMASTPCIEIDIAGATVRLRGAVDATQLRLVLHCLGRAV